MNYFEWISNDLLRYIINKKFRREDAAIFRCVCKRFRKLYDMKRLSLTRSLIRYSLSHKYQNLFEWLLSTLPQRSGKNVKIQINTVHQAILTGNLKNVQCLLDKNFTLSKLTLVSSIASNNIDMYRFIKSKISENDNSNGNVKIALVNHYSQIAAKNANIDMLNEIMKLCDNNDKVRLDLIPTTAFYGKIDMVKYLIDNKFSRSPREIQCAAQYASSVNFANGSKMLLDYLLANKSEKATRKFCAYIDVLNVDVLEWLYDNKFPIDDGGLSCAKAAIKTRIDILEWLIAHGFELTTETLEELMPHLCIRLNMSFKIFKKRKEKDQTSLDQIIKSVFETLLYIKNTGYIFDENIAKHTIKYHCKSLLKWLIDNKCPYSLRLIEESKIAVFVEKQRNLTKTDKSKKALKFHKWLKYDSGFFDFKRKVN